MNALFGKKIIWDGDSICAGNSTIGNWATRIAEKNEMTFKNYAVGGGTLTENFPLPPSGNKRHCVSVTIDRMYNEHPDADYVIFEGGTNDADLIMRYFDEMGDRMGTLDYNDFSGEYDRETFIGALESIFYRATKYWLGKKIGFIIAHKMGPEWDKFKIRKVYFEKCIEICKKWGIPYLDLWSGCYLNPYLPWMYHAERPKEENHAINDGFYADGQHLTARGYDFTTEIIERWLLTI